MINAVIELVVEMTAVEVVMREEKKEGIIQAKIGIVLNAIIVIIHSVKTVTDVKHLAQVQAVQALAAMKDMVVEMKGEVEMTAVEIVMTEEVGMTAVEVVMIEEVATVGVILTVHQTVMAQTTVMTGNAQSVKIAISLSVQNVIAVV